LTKAQTIKNWIRNLKRTKRTQIVYQALILRQINKKNLLKVWRKSLRDLRPRSNSKKSKKRRNLNKRLFKKLQLVKSKRKLQSIKKFILRKKNHHTKL
jgi:hypothetical protein